MAIEAQGIQFHRLSSIYDAIRTTSVDIQSTRIVGAGLTNFAMDGFTTAMWVKINTKSTELHRIKDVNILTIDIFGNYITTGSTDVIVYGYASTFIGEVTDFTGPGGSGSVIDITSCDSTSKNKMVGLRDEGQISLTMNFNVTDAGQEKLISDRAARKPRLYTIVFTDKSSAADAYPSWCHFNGYVMEYSISGGVDNKVTANAAIEIDGPVIWATSV